MYKLKDRVTGKVLFEARTINQVAGVMCHESTLTADVWYTNSDGDEIVLPGVADYLRTYDDTPIMYRLVEHSGVVRTLVESPDIRIILGLVGRLSLQSVAVYIKDADGWTELPGLAQMGWFSREAMDRGPYLL